jgi:hypothetical protein
MSAERQQGEPYQPSLFEEWEEGWRHDSPGIRALRGVANTHGVGPGRDGKNPNDSRPRRSLGRACSFRDAETTPALTGPGSPGRHASARNDRGR